MPIPRAPAAGAATRPHPQVATTDERLEGWGHETKRRFETRRLPGGSSYPRERAGVRALAALVCATIAGDASEEATPAHSDDEEEAKKKEALARANRIPGPFDLDDYYPEEVVEDESSVDTFARMTGLVAHNAVGRRERKGGRYNGRVG